MAYFDVAEVVAGMAVKARVHQHCVQNIDDRFSIRLRHVRSDIKIFRVFHILHRNGERLRNAASEGPDHSAYPHGGPHATGLCALECSSRNLTR